jgi:hypothetical protein
MTIPACNPSKAGLHPRLHAELGSIVGEIQHVLALAPTTLRTIDRSSGP